MPLTIEDRPIEWGKVRRRVDLLKKRSVHVGLTGRKGKERHQNAGVPVATVGMFHEFGTRHIKKRPFIRPVVTKNRSAIGRRLIQAASDWVFKNRALDNALQKLGDDAADAMELRIKSGITPDLADATIEAKGHALVLREEDQLIEALNARVLKRG